MFYDRKIKYVDVYENEEKVQSAGFVKLEARDNRVYLQIQVTGLRHTDTCVCPVVLVSEEKEAIIEELQVERGKGRKEFYLPDLTDMGAGISYEELEEIQIRPAGNRLLRCVVQERTHNEESVPVEVMPEEIQTEMKEKQAEEAVSEEANVEKTNVDDSYTNVDEEVTYMDDVVEEIEKEVKKTPEKAESKSEAELLKEAFLAEKRLREGDGTEAAREDIPTPSTFTESVELQPSPKEVSQTMPLKVVQEPQPVDKWHQLLAIYPHIRPFDDRREYLLMKPQDFVVLTEKHFPLSGNSFLLHGYYNYDHLIMSKERRPEGECFYIGVPGNFYDKEKQVAIMFGFESFEGKREPARIGDFGYYMIPVEI